MPGPHLSKLLRRFGHESFRPGQRRIIEDVLEGRDVLAVLPSGSGKLLVYQLAAQLLPGAAVVVFPLIALMKDQVEFVEKNGLEAGLGKAEVARLVTVLSRGRNCAGARRAPSPAGGGF